MRCREQPRGRARFVATTSKKHRACEPLFYQCVWTLNVSIKMFKLQESRLHERCFLAPDVPFCSVYVVHPGQQLARILYQLANPSTRIASITMYAIIRKEEGAIGETKEVYITIIPVYLLLKVMYNFVCKITNYNIKLDKYQIFSNECERYDAK